MTINKVSETLMRNGRTKPVDSTGKSGPGKHSSKCRLQCRGGPNISNVNIVFLKESRKGFKQGDGLICVLERLLWGKLKEDG